MTVNAGLGHGSSSALNFARIGIAWIASWGALDNGQDDHLEQVAGPIRPDDQPRSGSSPASSIASAWSMA
jgi:hypothetical protein